MSLIRHLAEDRRLQGGALCLAVHGAFAPHDPSLCALLVHGNSASRRGEHVKKKPGHRGRALLLSKCRIAND
jgi:hypothetical protein